MRKIYNIQAARASGMRDEDIQAFLSQNPDISPSESLTPDQGKLTDFIPVATGIAGGVLGAPLGPVGSIAGGSLGSGAGEFLRQLIEGEKTDVGRAGKEAALGLIGGGAGELASGALRVGGKVLSKTLSGVGDDLATRAFRPSPTALEKFAKTGEEFPQFLQRNNLAGADVDAIAEKAKVVQKAYDSLIQSGTKISGEKYSGSLLNEAVKYANADDPATQKIGEELFKLAGNIEKKYGSKMIPAKELRAQRIMTDELLPKNAFMNSPIDSGVSGVMRQTQKDLIDEAANTGATGKELQKFYNLLDIAEKGQYKGKGSLPGGITTLTGGAGGAAAGGVPGFIAGTAGTLALNNPRVINALSKASTMAGRTLPKIPGSVIAGQAFGQGGTQALFGGAPQGYFFARIVGILHLSLQTSLMQ